MMYGPETSKKVLLQRIHLFRQQNGLEELEYLDTIVENYLCGLPENQGKCEPVEMPLGILGYVKGGIAIIKNYMYKSFAPQEVAEERAAQCSTCPFNEVKEDSSWADMIALNSVGNKQTTYYDKLGVCNVCTCVLNMKVFYDGKIPKPNPVQKEKYESVNCWQLKIVE